MSDNDKLSLEELRERLKGKLSQIDEEDAPGFGALLAQAHEGPEEDPEFLVVRIRLKQKLREADERAAPWFGEMLAMNQEPDNEDS